MIKNIIFSLFFLLLSFSGDVKAFSPLHLAVMNPATPVPTGDAPVTVTTVVKTAMKTAGQAASLKSQIEKEIKSAYQSCCSEFMSIFEGKLPIDKNGASIQDTSGKIKPSSPASVKKGIYSLFMTLPYDDSELEGEDDWAQKMSEGIAKNKEYRKKADEFYEDTLIEIYNSILVLESDLANIEVQLNTTKEELTSTDKNSSTNQAAQTNSQAYETLDSLLVIWHQLVAMRAQLSAADAIANSITPVYRGKSGKQSFNMKTLSKEQFAGSFKYSSQETLSFAQLSETEEVEDSQPQIKEGFAGSSGISFQRVQTQERHAFTANAEKLNELAKLTDISTDVDGALEAHNALVSLGTYKSIIVSYNEMLEMHNKILQQVKTSDSYAINFLSRYFSDPWKVWSGGELGENFADYDIRKGISGWAKEAFDMAKAAKLSPVGAEEMVMPDVDLKEMQDNGNDLDIMMKGNKGVKSGSVTSSAPSKQAEVDKENRETQKLAWEIGANAFELLALSPQDWGTPTKSFPIWNDIKGFYNQYLNAKYANIEEYLRIDAEEIRHLLMQSNNPDADSLLAKKQEELAGLNNEITAANSDAQAEIKTLSAKNQSELQAKIKLLQAQKADLLSQMDAPAEYIKHARNANLDWQQKVQEEEIANQHKSAKSEEFKAWIGEDTADGNNDEVTASSGDESNAIYMKLMTGLKSGITSLDNIRSEVSAKEEEVNTLQIEADRIDKEIAKLRSSAVKTHREDVGGIRSTLASILDAIKGKKENTENTSAVEELTTGDEVADAAAAAAKVAANIAISAAVGNIYEKISDRIDQAKKELSNLGDELYLPEGHNKVVEIHKRLMNELRVLPLTVTNSVTGAVATLYVYEKLIPADITAEEEAYFVGLPPKERDLKAPKVAPYAKLAPMREIFYFDETDRYNSQPGKVSENAPLPVLAEDFLNYGGEVPEIWKLMLGDNPFVEKEFNLGKVLDTGCSDTMFFQGLSFPCKVKSTNIILAPNANGKLFQVSPKKLPQDIKTCANIEHLKGNQFYKSDDEYNFEAKKTDENFFCASSELGTILDADDDNNPRFRATSNNAFQRNIDGREETTNKKQSSEEKIRDYIYAQAMYTVNQVGEFLKSSEMEQTYRQNVDELRQKINETNQNLRQILQKFGFEPSDSYDISKESDYSLTQSKLQNFKSTKMQSAQSRINAVKTSDNEVVKERLQTYIDTLASLKKDSDAKMNLSIVSSTKNNLDEELRTSKANSSVEKEYKDMAKDTLKNMLKGDIDIYNAIY